MVQIGISGSGCLPRNQSGPLSLEHTSLSIAWLPTCSCACISNPGLDPPEDEYCSLRWCKSQRGTLGNTAAAAAYRRLQAVMASSETFSGWVINRRQEYKATVQTTGPKKSRLELGGHMALKSPSLPRHAYESDVKTVTAEAIDCLTNDFQASKRSCCRHLFVIELQDSDRCIDHSCTWA
jgi:hypothetical protein